jgi:hypothetical protein
MRLWQLDFWVDASPLVAMHVSTLLLAGPIFSCLQTFSSVDAISVCKAGNFPEESRCLAGVLHNMYREV